MGITVLVLVAILQQQPQVSERVLSEFLGLEGERYDACSAKRSLARHLHEFGLDDKALLLLAAIEEKPPGRLFDYFIQARNVDGALQTLYYHKQALPDPIERFLAFGGRRLADEAVANIRQADREGRDFGPAGLNPDVARNASQLVRLILLASRYGKDEEAIDLVLRHLTGEELHEHRSIISTNAVISELGYKLALERPELFTPLQLATLAELRGHEGLHEIALDALMTRPVDLSASRPERWSHHGLLHVLQAEYEGGDRERVEKVLNRYWHTILDRMVRSASYDQTMWEPMPYSFLTGVRLKELADRLVERGLAELQRTHEGSRILPSNSVDRAVDYYLLAGHEDLALRSKRTLAALTGLPQAPEDYVYVRKLFLDGRYEEYVVNDIELSQRWNYYPLIQYIVPKLLREGQQFRARGLLTLAAGALIEMGVLSSANMVAWALCENELREDARKLMLAWEAKFGTTAGEPFVSFLCWAAVGEEERALMSFAQEENERGDWLVHTLRSWEAMTGRPMTDLRSLEGRDVFAEALEKMSKHYVEGQSSSAIWIHVFVDVLNESRNEPTLTSMTLHYLKQALKKISPRSRTEAEYLALSASLGRSSEGYAPLPFPLQERVLQAVLEARKEK